jgi:glycosidase
MPHWSEDAIFYHVYPLGYCGAPERNDGFSEAVPRLGALTSRLDKIRALGANAIYLGPAFESVAHGYDTVDYRAIDRRLGTNADLAGLSRSMKERGMRLVLDAVFNHVGREHPWFRDLRERGPGSAHAGDFRGVDFSARSPAGDGFNYEGWNGCHDLVRLEPRSPAVREELVGAALSWIEDYGIDGLRLDAADCLDLDFVRELAAACRARKPGFWIMGEIIHGDYRRYAAPGLMDSVTNYECWKGLWSSLKDANYFEIAYALKRQFGEGGVYRGLNLYSFADNHDVNRAASQLPSPALLYPLYALLFTMPGCPSIYYGSERGIRGERSSRSDAVLRPSIEAIEAAGIPEPGLPDAIRRLASLRSRLPALRRGGYRELSVAPRQLAFARECAEGCAMVALNADSRPAELELAVPGGFRYWRDELEAEARPGGEVFEAREGRLRLKLHPSWARVLAPCG